MARVRGCVAHHGQFGFTLLEVLIAVLVLSLGLLGVAAMQLKALQSSHVSYQRSVATLAAQDAVERLWGTMMIIDPDVGYIICPRGDEVNGGDGELGVNGEWRSYWVSEGKLPGLKDEGPISVVSPCVYQISIEWEDGRFEGEGVSTLSYLVGLPGVPAGEGE
jgi:type IV pilus assembly protein PilV